jgi:Pyruvate/2-oxoacid:ferredoxin oxidoreductase delta subunit
VEGAWQREVDVVKRRIIEIDREKCNGCGKCVTACHEGAIRMVQGKAELVSDVYCDGLGDCIGECPVDAIRIIEREAGDFDPAAVAARKPGSTAAPLPPGGCPGAALRSFQPPSPGSAGAGREGGGTPSTLTNWPVQLHLLPLEAPFFHEAHLLLAADCLPFACPEFHQRLLAGRTLAVGCPKLDDVQAYREKLTEIFRRNPIRSVTVAYMEVPCCAGLVRLAREALAASGREIPCRLQQVSLRGEPGPLEEAGPDREGG